MKQKFKIWEIALMFGLVVGLFSAMQVDAQRRQLSEHVIRLHVIANSDTPEDQALKLQVRDAVLAYLQTIYPQGASIDEARSVLSEHMPDVEAAGQAAVTQWGYDYPVSVSLTQCWFPTKEYEDFALPAGQYEALRVELGDASGQNWWCVAFPPLCVGAASATVEDAVEAGLFTPDEAALITAEDEGYVIKFRFMELLGQSQE